MNSLDNCIQESNDASQAEQGFAALFGSYDSSNEGLPGSRDSAALIKPIVSEHPLSGRFKPVGLQQLALTPDPRQGHSIGCSSFRNAEASSY